MSAAWWSPVAPCTPQACVTGETPCVGPGRRRLRYAAGLAVFCAGLVFVVPDGPWWGPSRRDALVRRWLRALARALGVRMVAPAMPPRSPGGALVVSNHVSWLDILVVGAVSPRSRMLAKSDVAGWPVVGPVAVRSGTLFIDRERIRALPDTVAEIAGALRGGATVVVFPEGSTWCGRAQGHFRRAVFQAALDAGVPVQPVGLHYLTDGTASTAPAFVGSDSLLTSVWRVVSTRGLVAEVEVGEAIAPGSHPDRRSLAHAAQAGVTAQPQHQDHCTSVAPSPVKIRRTARRRPVSVASMRIIRHTGTATARATSSPAADA